jgi:hypothetical protein
VFYLKESGDRAKLGAGAVRDRLSSHPVLFEPMNVGGYGEVPPPERAARIRADYEAFLVARSEAVLVALKALAEGRNWPRVGQSASSRAGGIPSRLT